LLACDARDANNLFAVSLPIPGMDVKSEIEAVKARGMPRAS
jgi:hypothetical protein